MTNPPEIKNWLPLETPRQYRVLAEGWFADVEVFWADGSREWCADVLYTNSSLPDYVIAQLAVDAIAKS